MPRPPILNPQSIPVIGTDKHLAAVPTSRLTADALRTRFAQAEVWRPEIDGDGRVFTQSAARPPRPASVLVPLVQREDGLRVLLTRRTEHLRDHAGQVSFPGGRVEPFDADAVATALREAAEEVGLPASKIEVIGRLPVYATVTNFVVTPVVALVTPPFELRLDPGEVAEAFEVPLDFLMSPAHHRRHVFDHEGGQRQFLSMPWSGAGADGLRRDYFIWGATAAMLRNLYRFLSPD
jgi:8-oxo-dGTP pyrophosphatase MutT (NUDIX family)